jgi:hypothetical protein
MEEEIAALGVPRLSPAARVRALDEAIIVIRALSGGGDPSPSTASSAKSPS